MVHQTIVNLSFMDFFKQKNNMRTKTTIGFSLVHGPAKCSYASIIFYSVGFQSDASALLASLGLGCIKGCVTLTSTIFSRQGWQEAPAHQRMLHHGVSD